MADGIIIIDKPAGWTSMDVCGKLRGILKTKKVGHAGTLDPMATGVLPVFVGNATRAVSYAEGGDKEYVAGLRLGLTTNTQDTTGEVVAERPVSVTRAAGDHTRTGAAGAGGRRLAAADTVQQGHVCAGAVPRHRAGAGLRRMHERSAADHGRRVYAGGEPQY